MDLVANGKEIEGSHLLCIQRLQPIKGLRNLKQVGHRSRAVEPNKLIIRGPGYF